MWLRTIVAGQTATLTAFRFAAFSSSGVMDCHHHSLFLLLPQPPHHLFLSSAHPGHPSGPSPTIIYPTVYSLHTPSPFQPPSSSYSSLPIPPPFFVGIVGPWVAQDEAHIQSTSPPSNIRLNRSPLNPILMLITSSPPPGFETGEVRD